MNLLYLIIISATGYLKKNDEKYLIIDSTEKYEDVFFRIKSEIETLNGVKELFYEKNMLELELIQFVFKQATKIFNINSNY